MKKYLMVAAGISGVLAVVFYFTSLNHLDRESARLLETNTTINIQGTVFCAACAVICAVNVVGAIILHYLENNSSSSNASAPVSGGIKTEDGGVMLTAGNFWVCPKCKNRNPMSKVECRECGTVRN